MQRDAVLRAGLLDRLGALLARALVRLQRQGDFLARGDGRQEDAECGGIFDGLGGALRDVRSATQ